VGGALITVGFVELLRSVHEWLWVDLPSALDVGPGAVVFIVPMCATGGVLVGVCRRRLGEYPPSLAEALARFRTDRAFDDRHLPQAVTTSLVGLGFGAALGPEAVLVALVGGIATWIGRQISAGADGRRSLVYLGTTAVLGSLIGSPGAAVVPLDGDPGKDRGRLWLIVPGVAAAAAGAWVFRSLSSGGGYFSYDYPPYDFDAVDLAWAVPLAVAGVAVSVFFLAASRVTGAAGAMLDSRPVLQSLAGGLVLGALASISALVLFSGHAGVQTLIDDSTTTVGFLLGIAVLKLIATSTLLGTNWKGGRFFPVMFAAAAVGLAAAQAFGGLAETPAVAVVMTAAVGALIGKPVAAPVVMVFIFPLAVAPAVIVGGVLAGLLGQRVVARFPGLAGESGTAAEADGW
jgi:H+/Cl- antiporter ClcA